MESYIVVHQFISYIPTVQQLKGQRKLKGNVLKWKVGVMSFRHDKKENQLGINGLYLC